MRIVSIICLLLAFFTQQLVAEEKSPGANLGAKVSEAPHWFKESFLEFEDDVAEAAEEGKRVMLYFHQEGCPYCAKLVEESFNNPQTKAFIRQHFDGITINMWGDREVVSVSGKNFSEKTFAAALKVQYTPTIIFFDEQGRVALRVDGYYPPGQFRTALGYVASGGEKRGSFSEYVLQSKSSDAGSLIKEAFYQESYQLDQMVGLDDRPLAVFFESTDCDGCRIMHEKILVDTPTLELVKQTTSVQLNVGSNQVVTTPDGRQTTASDWARSLGISYTPSIVFFDRKGAEVMRISGFVKTFHFQSVFAYVLEKAYLHQPSFQRYISERGDKIREAGFDTDIWGYQSSHQ